MAGPGRERILAIDVVRGLAVVGMLLVNDAGIPAAMPLALRHAPWQGLTVADQVFPLFLFTVGASMPFSERAQRPVAVLRRVAALVVLGSLLVSAKHHQLAPSTGVLQQIAGAYLLAWAVLRLPRRTQLPAAAVLLAGLWAAFTFVPAAGVRPGSWASGSNLAEFVDRSLLGHYSEHGVLVMVASSVSVLAGVTAGRLLRRAPTAGVTRRLLAVGGGHAGAGAAGRCRGADQQAAVDTVVRAGHRRRLGAACRGRLPAGGPGTRKALGAAAGRAGQQRPRRLIPRGQ
jgi:predicted acyltransferase